MLEWRQSDRDKLVALLLYSRTRCPGCGTNPSVWLDENKQRVDPPPFVADTIHCYGCETKSREEKQFPQNETGYYVRLVRNPEQ